MEVGATIERPEIALQVDLLEVFADREVSIFGLTGTFRDLAAMCPIDLDDARITLEDKNEFVVKAANEAGLEIDQSFEGIFSRITAERGLERKFTVAASENTTAADRDRSDEHAKVDATDKPVDAKDKGDVVEELDAVQAVDGTNLNRIIEYQTIAGRLALNEVTRQRKIHEDEAKGLPTLRVATPVTAVTRKVPNRTSARPRQEKTKLKARVEAEASGNARHIEDARHKIMHHLA